ncbi:MAG TPA: hypothetical protein VEX15_17970 [Nocardioidaceae bacterium]|nr:hypothetical protein [Nocardioidaceae bacterium]
MPGQTSLWWLPWVVALSALATWWALSAWRRGEHAAAMRRFGWAIVPWSAWLLGMFTLGWRIGDALGDWGTRFVFNPAAWLGFIAAGVAVVMIWVGSRFGGSSDDDVPDQPRKRRKSIESDSGSGSDEFADIEAILKKRGIT